MAHVAQGTAWPGCKQRVGHVAPAARQPCRRFWASQIDLDTHGYVHNHGALLRHALLGPLVMRRCPAAMFSVCRYGGEEENDLWRLPPSIRLPGLLSSRPRRPVFIYLCGSLPQTSGENSVASHTTMSSRPRRML